MEDGFLFSCQYDVKAGNRIWVVGNVPELGQWDLNRTHPLNWSEGNIWSKRIKLNSKLESIEYKFVKGTS